MKKFIFILAISLIPVLGFSYGLKKGSNVKIQTATVSKNEMLENNGEIGHLIEKRINKIIDKIGVENLIEISITHPYTGTCLITVIYKS